MKKVSKNVKETREIAKIFLKKISNSARKQGASVVGLSGDLGTGKTVFTQAVGKYLGVKNKITSPTFVIMKKYPIPEQAQCGAGPLKNTNYKFLFHHDAYRLKDKKELLHLGWEEIINNKNYLVFIEWPENVFGAMPTTANFVYISHHKNGHRNFELK